jgi:hypothetical protein
MQTTEVQALHVWIRQYGLITYVAKIVTILYTSALLPVGIRERCCLHSPLPTTLHQLCAWITDAIAQVEADILRQIRDEIAYQCGTSTK